MFKFFVTKKENDYFFLSSETLKHIKIARITNEYFICVFEELFFKCKLVKNKALIVQEIYENHEFEKEVIIAASLINSKKFNFLIQKACELGATKLIPVFSTNVALKIPPEINKKVKRWNKIAISSAEQSFRNKAMEVVTPMSFNDVLQIKVAHKYIAYEKNNSSIIKSFPQDSIFLIGPEGGFTSEEVLQASKNGFEIISLGKRILRSETASIFVLSRVN